MAEYPAGAQSVVRRCLFRMAAVLSLVGLLAGAGFADDAVYIGGVEFPAACDHQEGPLPVVGGGVLRWKLLFRAYATAFYLSPEVTPAQWSRDVAKCLVIHYFWDIPGDRFGPAGEEILGRMHPAAELSGIRTQLDAIDRAYVDVQEGDRYALVYTPGRGTTLLHNGAPLATLAGADFARLYFSIWLGADPVDRGLRDELLGRP